MNNIRQLVKHLTSKISLPDFIENTTGHDIRWYAQDESAKCTCPFHNENEPSFNINLWEDAWVYNCFGCGEKGNIITFCRKFFNLNNNMAAIKKLCEYFNIENVDDLMVNDLQNIEIKINQKTQIEHKNLILSNQGRLLLKKDPSKNSKWVMEMYKRLNDAVNNNDIDTLSKIENETHKRMRG
jgi:hypothetical protein